MLSFVTQWALTYVRTSHRQKHIKLPYGTLHSSSSNVVVDKREREGCKGGGGVVRGGVD